MGYSIPGIAIGVVQLSKMNKCENCTNATLSCSIVGIFYRHGNIAPLVIITLVISAIYIRNIYISLKKFTQDSKYH